MKIRIDWRWVKKELLILERITKFKEEVDAPLKKAKSLARPKVISIEKKIISLKRGAVELEGGIRLSTERIASYIRGAEAVSLFLVTIGGGVEKAASRFMSEGEDLRGYLLDRIGSLAVESLAESVEKRMRRDYLKIGESISMRFSPGYCDWPIEEQKILSKILDFSKAGVSLTENCMMVPKKSISAMVGIGEKKRFSKIKSPCAICSMKDCDHRRTS